MYAENAKKASTIFEFDSKPETPDTPGKVRNVTSKKGD